MFNHAVDCLNCVVSCHISVSTHFTLIIHFKCLIMLYLYLLNHNHNILQNMSHFFSEWMWHGPRLPGYLVRLSGISLCARRACKFVQLHRQTLGKRATEAHCWRPPAAFHAKPWPFKNKKKKRTHSIPFDSIPFSLSFCFCIQSNALVPGLRSISFLCDDARILIYTSMMNDNERGFVYYFVSGIKFFIFSFSHTSYRGIIFDNRSAED